MLKRDTSGRFVSSTAAPESGLTRNQLIQELSRSTHGKLEEYVPISQRAAREDGEFFSRLIAWNFRNGQVRDSKVALPIVFLTKSGSADKELRENALAHVAMLDPRNLVRALKFARSHGGNGSGMGLRHLTERYLRSREKNWPRWEHTAVQHRASMKTLYSLNHIKPNAMADLILFKKKYPTGTVFEAISRLKDMTPIQAAGEIITKKIPFLVAQGALGEKVKDEALVMALIERMSPTELVTNMKMLERLGVKASAVLRSALEQALKKASTSKQNTLKASKAVEALEDDALKAKISALQEKQIESLSGIEGNWLVLGDKSGSMEGAIESARHVAGTLARMVKGNVYLVFFDVTPTYYPVTGKTYEEIKAVTNRVQANGGTSVGCGLLSIMERGLEVDGIAIVSDGEENTVPMFWRVYEDYTEKFGKKVPVYYYKVRKSEQVIAGLRKTYGYGAIGHDSLSSSMESAGFDLQKFEIGPDIDYYALPNLVQTMRTNRYSLSDEIMQTPLLTLAQVFGD